MEKIRLVIFDLDGTLVDAYPAITRSFNYAMQKLGYPGQSPGVIRRAVGWGDEKLLKPFIKTRDLRRAVLLYRSHHKRSLIRYSHLYPRAVGVLRYLKGKGYKLAIASNRPTEFSRILIHHLGLGRYLDYILCADRLSHIKPHPEILNKIIQKFSLKNTQAIYIGDMSIDAQAGKRADIRTIIVATGSSTRKQIEEEAPERIIIEIAGLLKIL